MADERDLAELAGVMIELSFPERVEVLRQVFAAVEEPPRNQLRQRLVLAVSTEYLGEGVDDRWGLDLVGFPDRDHYDGGYGPEPDLSEDGRCPTCQAEVCSTAKRATCPRCGSTCFLT